MKTLYDPSTIRTQNMLPDRSADVEFDPKVEPSMTQQKFLQECDINYIVDQNAESGFISHLNRGTPRFGDFGDSVDFQSALNYLSEAQSAFDSIDARTRALFQNDPGKLLDFLADPNNIEEAVRLGLAEYVPEPEPTPTPSKSQKASKTPPNEAEE